MDSPQGERRRKKKERGKKEKEGRGPLGGSVTPCQIA
jgi:hypothetical protein